MEHLSPVSASSGNSQQDEKAVGVNVISTLNHEDGFDDRNGLQEKTQSTRLDFLNMRRMGRQQQLVRRFRLFSVMSFTAIATASWELGIFMITPALVDGGPPVVLYSILWCFLGFGPIYLSMAEMASMAPIAGAQYHWVSEFAPERLQKILSYFTGWTSTLAWQAGNALGVFLVGSLIQVIIQINVPDYGFAAWQATLLVILAVVIAFVGNVYGAKILPLWQNWMFGLHCLAYFFFIIPVWVNAPRATHAQVWRIFENNGGWPNMTLTVLIGQVVGVYSQVGLDTAAHMSEDTKDAAVSVPRAMMLVYVVNFVLVFPAVITLCYALPDVESALQDPTTYPAVYVLRQAMSPACLTVLLVAILILLTASNISYLAAVTRDLFAFARDHGVPFSKFWSKVDEKRNVPTNATLGTSIVGICMALIYLGSPVAFYAITSLCTVALLQCYCLSIGCLLWRRITHPQTLPPATFSLGKAGIPINIVAVLFSFWCFFWAFWPQASPVTASGFNWASGLFVATLVVAVIDYIFRGRHAYHGPVKLVRGRFDNVE